MIPVLGKNVDLSILSHEEREIDFSDSNWSESVSMYPLARAWTCSGVDLDPFRLTQPESAESVLLGILPLCLFPFFLFFY